MISEYHRPVTIEAAVELLSRADPPTVPMAGGTRLNRPSQKPAAVVDLQALNLDKIVRLGSVLQIGATVTLQQLFEAEGVPAALKHAVHQEASVNLRQMGTIAGALVSADGRSPLTTVLLAMDSQLVWMPGEKVVALGEYLPLRGRELPGRLIVRVDVPVQVKAAFAMVARTPDDFPLVSAAMALWPSGRRRLVIGGYGDAPLVVMDGTGTGGVEETARDAYSHTGDAWASAEYRREMAAVLARRCADEVEL